MRLLMRKSQKWPTLSIRTIYLRFNAGIADAEKMDLPEIGRIRPLCPALSRMSWLKQIMVLFCSGNHRYSEFSWCFDKTRFISWLDHVKSVRIEVLILTSFLRHLNLAISSSILESIMLAVWKDSDLQSLVENLDVEKFAYCLFLNPLSCHRFPLECCQQQISSLLNISNSLDLVLFGPEDKPCDRTVHYILLVIHYY